MSTREGPARSLSERAASVAPSRAASSAGFGRSLSSVSGPTERRRKAPRPALGALSPFRGVRADTPSPEPAPPPPPPPPPAAAPPPPPVEAQPRPNAGELRDRAEALRAAAAALERDAAKADRKHGAAACAPGGPQWAGLACVSQVWEATAKLVCAGLWWPAPMPPPPPRAETRNPRRSSSVVVPVPDGLAPIRVGGSRGDEGGPVSGWGDGDRTARSGRQSSRSRSPELPATSGKRVATRLPRSSSAVFSLGDNPPAHLFKPTRRQSTTSAMPDDHVPREALPLTAELMRSRSLRPAPPAEERGTLRSAMRTINAIVTPRVLWRHKHTAQDVAQAKENGLLR